MSSFGIKSYRAHCYGVCPKFCPSPIVGKTRPSSVFDIGAFAENRSAGVRHVSPARHAEQELRPLKNSNAKQQPPKNSFRSRIAGKFAPFQIWWLRIPGNLRGCIWILIASLFFAFMVAFIKLAGVRLPVPEILFLRQITMLLLASPAIIRSFPGALRTQRLDLQLVRVGAAFFAMLLGFTAVVHLPLAEATTIQFAKNFFMTILAILLLGEVVGVRRWAAIIAGFIGVVVVAWPGSTSAFNIYGLMAIASAGAVGLVTILVRKLTQVDPPITIMCYQALGVGLLMLPLTIIYWTPPTVEELAL
ncbi:MAG TPA: DMT family transporter, partial [Hyphomicrobiaceae bacterium]|nr:DMT family transporter [Hyphomicrobiaceae bacterium]